MKGFNVQINNQIVSGGIQSGMTNVIISCKEGRFEVFFGSVDMTGMVSYIWHSGNLDINDKVMVRLDNIDQPVTQIEIRDYNDPTLITNLEIETYHKLKEELINEGMIER